MNAFKGRLPTSGRPLEAGDLASGGSQASAASLGTRKLARRARAAETGPGAGKVKALEKVSTVSTGAGEIATPDLSTETLRLALLDPVQ
jgi:hypothetical protein